MPNPVSSKVRLFLAVRPDPTALRALEQAITPVRTQLPSARLRWTELAKLHLTLRFFGSVPSDTPARIDAACREGCARRGRFSLALAGAGAFPNPRRGSVLWIGATDGAAALSELAEDLNARLDALGLEREERAFKPHLTVARSREPLPLTAAVAALSSVAIATPIEAVFLVRSQPGGPAARYEDLETYKLGR